MTFACLLLLVNLNTSFANSPTFIFQQAEQNERFHGLLKELRCLVCQNQDLLESHAELAQDLKAEVFSLVNKGKNNEEIRSYLRQRYGEFILFKPDLNANTWLLWFGPLLFLVIGVVGLGCWVVRGKIDV